MESVKVDLPYPSTSDLDKDAVSAEIIYPAYAGIHGEITAILQYVYHALFFKKAGDEKTAKLLTGIAVTEMHHQKILGETILALGLKPVYKLPSFEGGYYNAAYETEPVIKLSSHTTDPLEHLIKVCEARGYLTQAAFYKNELEARKNVGR